MVSIIIKEWTTKIELVPAVQKRNAAVLLRKPGRLASQYADYKVQGPKTYENAPDDIVGKSVKHKAYGAGKIISVKGSMMTVLFPTVGEKTLNYEVCTEKHLIEFIE